MTPGRRGYGNTVSYRQHATKPTTALWALIGAADVALLLTGVGAAVVLLIVSVVTTVLLAALAAWLLTKRGAIGHHTQPALHVRMDDRLRRRLAR